MSAAIAVLAIAAAIVQRAAAGYPMALQVVFGVVAVLPFALDVVDLALPVRTWLPEWLFPIPVLVGTAYLVWHPVEVDFIPFLLVFMTAEIVSRSSGRRWLAVGVTLTSMAVMVIAEAFGRFDYSLIWVIGIGFGAFGGQLIQSLAARTAELKAAEADLAEKAVAEERQRIAREVHDVIAHSLSVTMLHVTAARMALEKREPHTDDALEALREAEGQGRASLAEIRRTVGILGGSEGAAEPPMPDALDIPKLVEDFRRAGMDVSLSIDGEVTELPASTGLSLYRVVQESLTNATKYAPGASARVELTLTDETISLWVRNTASEHPPAPSSNGGGLGVRGMIERAAVLDGTLVAGPDGNGWSVVLRAPMPAEAQTDRR